MFSKFFFFLFSFPFSSASALFSLQFLSSLSDDKYRRAEDRAVTPFGAATKDRRLPCVPSDWDGIAVGAGRLPAVRAIAAAGRAQKSRLSGCSRRRYREPHVSAQATNETFRR